MARLPRPVAGTAVRLILCRHGETALNAKHILQGSGVNPPLNDRGQAQAERLGQRLVDEPIDWIISSELVRARQTADAIAAHHPNVPRNVYADLAEICWGEFEGLHSPDLSALHSAWDGGDHDYAPLHGESPKQVSQRSCRQLFSIINEARSRPSKSGVVTVAIVIHGRLLRIMLTTLLHRSLHLMNSINHHNANLNVVDVVLPSSPAVSPTHLPLLRTLPTDALASFSHAHFHAQTLPHLAMQPTPLTSADLSTSYARVWDAEHGVIAAPWPRDIIDKWATLELVSTQLTTPTVDKASQPPPGSADVVESNDDATHAEFWLVGAVINDVQHLEGLTLQ